MRSLLDKLPSCFEDDNKENEDEVDSKSDDETNNDLGKEIKWQETEKVIKISAEANEFNNKVAAAEFLHNKTVKLYKLIEKASNIQFIPFSDGTIP